MDIYFWLREMAIEAQYKEGMGSEKRRRLLEAADEIERLREALKASVATIGALYEHLERVEKAGGATSLEGVAACHIMLKSMRKNANRVEELVMKPARAALKGDE